jgi:cytosine/adenosine deaminase-related metal-dependent hydrolase
MRTVIRHVRVFDGADVIPGTDLLIDGDHIGVYENGSADIEIDGAGKTVIPGLIDAHTHNVDGDLEQALTFGVTTELDMFCLPSKLSRQRRIARERDDVADIRSAGVLATAPGGHPSQIMLADPSLKERYGDAVGPFDTIASADQPESFVKKRMAEGID